MILYSETYLKMHQIAQNGVNALRMNTLTLRKIYTDFKQPLTEDDTVKGRRMRSLRYYWHMVQYHPRSSKVSFERLHQVYSIKVW